MYSYVYLVDTLTISKPVDEGSWCASSLALQHRLATDRCVDFADCIRVKVIAVEEDLFLVRSLAADARRRKADGHETAEESGGDDQLGSVVLFCHFDDDERDLATTTVPFRLTIRPPSILRLLLYGCVFVRYASLPKQHC